MAKKRPRPVAKLHDGQPSSTPFDDSFPSIARWILQEEGWVELGADHYSRSLVRVLDRGGMVWEGTDRYQSLNEALRAMDEGIAAWLSENLPDSDSGKTKEKSSATQPVSSSTRKKAAPKPKHPKIEARRKLGANPPVPRAVAEKVRKLAEMAEALREGQHFQVTRLTSLKGLCKDEAAARSFAMFLAVHARDRAKEKDAPERVQRLIKSAITEMEFYLDDPTKERKERLFTLLLEIEKEQDEYEQISWGQVRIVHSRELLVVEKAMKSLLRDHEAPFWLYQAARDYTERYNSRSGSGLIPDSAPMMQEIADFWRDFYGTGR